MSKEPVSMILLEPYVESVTAMVGVLSKTTVAELIPVPSADEAWQAAQQFLPCVLVVSIHGHDDGYLQLGMLRKLEKQIRSGQLKPLVIVKTKKHPLAREIAELGVTDYVEEPVPTKSLLFKLKIFFQAINALKKRPGGEDEAIVIKASAAVAGDDARTLGTTELGYKPALQLGEDIFVFSGPPPLKGISGYLLEAEGPAPGTGEWKAKSSAHGKPAWQWVSKVGDEAGDTASGWVHEGDQPEFDATKNRWKLKSKKPRLAYWRNGKEEATKVETDAEGKVLVAEDSQTARENLTLNRTLAAQATEELVKRALKEQTRGEKKIGREAEAGNSAEGAAGKPAGVAEAKELASVWKKLADEANQGREKARGAESVEAKADEDLYEVKKKEKRASLAKAERVHEEAATKTTGLPVSPAMEENELAPVNTHDTTLEIAVEPRDRRTEGEPEAAPATRAHEAMPAQHRTPPEKLNEPREGEEEIAIAEAAGPQPEEEALRKALRGANNRPVPSRKEEPTAPRERLRRERRNMGRAKALTRARKRAERLREEAEKNEREAEALETEQLEEQLAELEQDLGPEASARAAKTREERARAIQSKRERAAAARRGLEATARAIAVHESAEVDLDSAPTMRENGEKADRNFRAIESMSEAMAVEYLGKKESAPRGKPEPASPSERHKAEPLPQRLTEEGLALTAARARKSDETLPPISPEIAKPEENAAPDSADNVVELRPERKRPTETVATEQASSTKKNHSDETKSAADSVSPDNFPEDPAAAAHQSEEAVFESATAAAYEHKTDAKKAVARELSPDLRELLGFDEERAAAALPVPPPPQPWKTAELLLLVELSDSAHDGKPDPERLLAALRAALPGWECRFEPKRALEDVVPSRGAKTGIEAGWPSGDRGVLYVSAPEPRELSERVKLLARSTAEALAANCTEIKAA